MIPLFLRAIRVPSISRAPVFAWSIRGWLQVCGFVIFT